MTQSVDPQRYSHTNLPKVGDTVLSPAGRRFTVQRVFNSAKVLCLSEDQNARLYFQANDLRKVS